MKKGFVIVLLVLLLFPATSFANGSAENRTEEVAVEYTPAGTYPITETPISVDIMVSQSPCVEDFNTNEFTKFMEEKTGVHVNFIQVPVQAAAEKLTLTLASGAYPDAFLGFEVSNDLEATYGAQEHLFMPLNKYFSEEWTPNLMKALEDFPNGIGALTNLDGYIYSLPMLKPCYHCANSVKMFYYKPFLDKLGLDVPTTTDEFYETLKAIKEQDPNGNGKKDEIPLAGAMTGWNTRVENYLLNSFIYCDLNTDLTQNSESDVGYMMDGDKIDTSVNKDAYRKGLSYINKLYKEGLIYNGSFTQDSSQLTQLVENGEQPTVGFAPAGWRGKIASLSGDRYAGFRAMAPLEGPDGVQEAVNTLQVPESGRLVISADCKYPEAIIRYFDYLYSTEGILTARNGFENEAWKYAEPGQIGLNGMPAIWEALTPWNNKDPQNVTWVSEIIGAIPDALRNGQAVTPMDESDPDYYGAKNNAKFLFDVTKKYYRPYAHTELEVPSLKYTAEENEQFATVKAELANFIRQSAVKFMVGSLDVNDDDVWNSYLDNLEKLQLPAVLEIMQTAYDRQYR
jgi:putative aldouronate transport system substrate-binding protein